jgi:uncharacterized protein
MTPLPTINSCDGCGACCMEQCSPPFVFPRDPQLAALPAEVLESYHAGLRQRDADGWPDAVPCFWFDLESRQCIHYEHRPEICRTGVEIGDEACRSWRAHAKID